MTTAQYLFRSAQEKFNLGRYRDARELARAGLLHDEYHPGLLEVYGLAAYRLDDLHDSMEGLERASMVAPLSPLSQLILAELYLRVGKRANAAAGLAFLAEPGRCPTPLLPDLSRLLGTLGAFRKAFKVCHRLTRLRPWYHPAHYGMGFYLAKLKQPTGRILRHLRAAHDLAPRAVPYRVAMAEVLVNAGRCEEAIELIRCVPPFAVNCCTCLKRLQAAAESAGDGELAMRFRERFHEVVRDRGGEADRDCCGA
jgi:tetratricopeptide (TPR) repeat protein